MQSDSYEPIEKRVEISNGYDCRCASKVTFSMNYCPKCGVKLNWLTNETYMAMVNRIE